MLSSAPSVTNLLTTPNNIVDMVESNHLLSGKETLCFSTRHHKSFPLSLTQMKIRVPRTLAFASAKGKGKAERQVEAIVGDNASKELNWSFDFPDSKPEFSLLHSEDYQNISTVLEKLNALRSHLLAAEKWNASRLQSCDRKYLECATNLIHYMALRSLDTEQLNSYLTSLGLSSLDNNDLSLLSNLEATINLLMKSPMESRKLPEKGMTIKKNEGKVSSLLGKPLEGKKTHIMVTVGKEATESETFIADILKAGASVIRINCAHGDPTIWGEIIKRVRRTSQMLEMPCRVLMDLAGPKLRTGTLKPGPCVMKVSPKKDAFGNVVSPALVWLSVTGTEPPAHLSPDATIFVRDQEFLAGLRTGDSVRLCDARGKKKVLRISKEFDVFSSTGFVAECLDTAYVESGTELYVKGKKGRRLFGQVVDVPPKESFVRLRVGDLLVITREGSFDEPSVTVPGAHRLTCPSGYLFDSVKPGETIGFDDGKIWGTIKGASPSEVIVSITHAGPKGTKLGSEKSINIPQSDIRFKGLTSKDIKDLEYVASHADMVGISFIRDVQDISVLRQELKKRKLNDQLGIVLKIETESGFEHLPLILLEAMKCLNPLGVMIARGDLAVECGWERLANIQEEILAICKVGRVPVILATQVLESLVKSGVPTRAEITDAANGRRASCVMLNKGKHIVEAVSMLDTILHTKLIYKKPNPENLH
ncbi:plastidial pyruvate kinase 4, chloroplastic isoform X2 [Raphanus sativus]|uniref:pyruvate kinase n=1 Tax=Raphanus sativus TaxID=3726 RepID=A0A9W3CYX5_RAPSA|nr:plastidial pyruvate kinase 4, chloroplastic isoform X2 [Raphanus sativus]XP_056856681.1 plastidial pyruvate kinase 4, chloroplastic isoform X2 [Raphanus sativus]XP_056856687.1 plastidial pyruvate kinase 4, chloroplastic isoform X2 [Raphanus sativus]XP_056856692.1 plastidial pyruvate kinase 4, chloroplastic isoform X2 [Raphanus sativus]